MIKLKTVLIVGATSPIARAYADRCAQAGHSLILAGRDLKEIKNTASDLAIRYEVKTEAVFYDASKKGSGISLAKQALAQELDSTVVFHGIMVGREGFSEMLQINCASIAELFEALIDGAVASDQKPTLAAVSSVAGDRGRQSNYPYGASKAALDAYLSGLRNRAYPLGINVITIKPGFVRTRLTEGKVNPNSPLLASPEKVAGDIFGAVRVGLSICYTPWFWAYIMCIIRLIPEFIFKRLKL
jgi:decaprenylphospho-beta-D-erythro-pentofuranosid-2-ulose 2-reductase